MKRKENGGKGPFFSFLHTFTFGLIIAAMTVSVTFANAEEGDRSDAIQEISDDAKEIKIETDPQGNVFVPPASEKALSYYRSGNFLWVIHTVFEMIVPALIVFFGFSAKMRDVATRIGRKWFFIIAVYYIMYATLTTVIDLPLSFYSDFIRPHDYGLSNQSFGRWIGNTAKEYGLNLLGGILFLWIPYLLIRKSPTRWYLYSGLLSIPFAFIMMIVTPIWISPLFNNFGPMKDKALETKITALAQRAGIDNGNIFEVDKSMDTDTVNAYVIGFMDTKRIVLWDTILKRLSEDEILFILGHEMGYYVLNHHIESVLFYSFLTILILFFVNRFSTYIMRKYFYRVKFSELSDIASLPLIIFMLGIFSLIMDPVSNSYSRNKEQAADKFGLEITRNNYAAASAFVKLQTTNLANPYPGPLFIMWRSTHPPIGKRIEFINNYKPWEKGENLEYEGYFTAPSVNMNKESK